MVTNTRGFLALSGETIISCDTTAINIVTLTTQSGKIIELNADDQHFGIAVLRCDLVQNSTTQKG